MGVGGISTAIILALFMTDLTDEAKYDFIIHKTSTDAIIQSLRSYGLEIERNQQTTELIKFEFKE